MLNNFLKNISKSNHINFEELKNKWVEAEEISKQMGKDKHPVFSIGVLKNMLGLKEVRLSIEELSDLFLQSKNINFEIFYEELISSDIPPSLRPELPYKGKISTGEGEVDQDQEDNEEKIRKVLVK